jgi:hypothetical protein
MMHLLKDSGVRDTAFGSCSVFPVTLGATMLDGCVSGYRAFMSWGVTRRADLCDKAFGAFGKWRIEEM